MILWWVLVACGGLDPGPEPEPGLEARSEGGAVTCAFSLDPEPPALGELFATEVTLTAGGEPVTEAAVQIDATMPAHDHGMLTAPRHGELGAGRYRTEGMKLHMAGRWEIAAAWEEDTCRVVWDQPVQASP